MNRDVGKKERNPAYIQLYRQFVKDIVSGVYKYGDKLPSKRTLSADTGLSVITVEHAMTLLSEEGYVESRQRSGVIVIYRGEDFLEGRKREKALVLEKSEPVHNTSEFPFSVITRTMRRVMLDYGDKILVKSANHGCAELRNELCRYLARSRGIVVGPHQVVIGSGAEYLYGLVVQLLGADEIYALESPSYKKIYQVYNAMGAKCDMLKLTDEGIDSRELARTQARILHVTPFSSYPSGVTASISKKHEYLRWAKQRGGVLIEDNYESELTVSRKPEEPLFSMEKDVNVIYINTFSRTIASSIRVGYMILPEKMVDTFNCKLGFYSCPVPIFDQYVLAELLKSGDFERHINRVRRKKRKGILGEI
jgi:GntR family transcriptional regulator/MocR family aminotransferase